MPSEESRVFYETVARYYDAENAFLTEDLAFYGDLAAGCEGAVLDVGSGTGRVVLFLAGEEGVPATGIEFSAEMLARARRRLPRRRCASESAWSKAMPSMLRWMGTST